MGRDQPIVYERLLKIGLVGFTAAFSAMVVFAGVAKGITRVFFEDDPSRSSLPMLAFIPALAVAGLLAWVGWHRTNWRRFALWQLAFFVLLFGVLLLILGP